MEDSVKVLETYVNQSRDVSLPKPSSIGAIVLGDMVGHDWCLVHTVSGREMSAQVGHDPYNIILSQCYFEIDFFRFIMIWEVITFISLFIPEHCKLL